MKNHAILAVLIAVTGCSRQQEPAPATAQTPGSFFVGVNVPELPEPTRSVVASAERNIGLVLRGYPPDCTTDPASALSDGGTLTYKCKGYDLTVLQRLHKVGDIYGTIYGPVVTFPGDYQISYVRFFTNEQLTTLMEHQDGRQQFIEAEVASRLGLIQTLGAT